jgi:hypothetical protein
MYLQVIKAFMYFQERHLTHMQYENGRQGIFYLHPDKKARMNLDVSGKAISKLRNIIKKDLHQGLIK